MAVPQDDNDVLHDLKSNNEEFARQALEKIYREYHDLMITAAYAILFEMQDCEDISHDLIKYIWDNRHKLEISSLKDYLYTSARNRALQLKRISQKGKIKITLTDDMEEIDQSQSWKNCEDEGASTDDRYDKIEKQKQVIEKRKHEKAFQVFDMHVFQGLKLSEIANILGVSVETAKTQYKNVKEILRNT